MSRLGMNAEPSMEEILASIRKIIAEEPPGSRMAPSTARAAAPSPAPMPQRGFMSREAFMRSSAPPEPEDNEPSFHTPKSEPQPDTKSTAEQSHSVTGREQNTSQSSASAKNLNGYDHSSADRSSNSADKSESAPIADAEEISKAATAAEPEAKSIEAQLADLLGDELQALNGAQHGDVDASINANIEVDPTSVSVEESATPEPRPGFTVSRIGFTNGSAEAGDGGDPFAFDLGPSPFASHSPEEFSPEHQKPGSLDQSSKRPLRGEDDHAASSMPDLTPASATSAKTTDSATAARPKEPFAVPSVAATLGPHRTLEPLSAAFQSAPFEQRSFENQSFENRSYEQRPYEQGSYEKGPYEQASYEQRSPQPEVASQSENARNSSVRAEFRGERLERMLQPAPAEEAVPQRLMEDAMADLLRPLLRTWLAENMPKIVERALRREMTERLLPGQKGPFD